MAIILWTEYQEAHISDRHQVSAEEFEEAWHDRAEADVGHDPDYGEYYEGFGLTNAGRCLYLVWRWQDQDEESGIVWPITAYEPEEAEG